MEERGKETITAFDTALTTDHIRMLKVFLPYLPPRQQNGLAVYIKFSELQYALQLMRQRPACPIYGGHRTVLSLSSLMDGSLLFRDRDGVIELLDELLPYGTCEEQARIRELKNLLNSLGQLREMMDMMEMMKELFPEGSDSTDDGSGMGNLFSGMSGMDPQMLAQLMQSFQSCGKDDGPQTDNT